jgi:myo-inositol 2-dehydrogenase/D-chiro-inositol 1-dehydrogenase
MRPIKRRAFLQQSAAGLGACTLVSSSLSAANRDELKCALIGTGDRGSAHLKAIQKVNGVHISALCDIHEGRLAQAAKLVEDHRPTTFSDYRRVLDTKDLDAVFIATPCNLHAQMAIDALESGKHCYCEKPVALSVADLDRVAAAETRTKPVFQVGLQLRYAHPYTTSVEAVQAGKIGTPVLIRAHRHNTSDIARHKSWFFDRKQSGDIICEQAVHEFDLFNWVFGKVPERASGFGGRAVLNDPPRNIMDHYTLMLDYGSNQRVSYSHCWFASPADPGSGRQEVVVGSQASMNLEKAEMYEREGRQVQPLAGPKTDSTLAAISDFFACVREGRTPKVGVEIGRNAVLVALLGLKAINERRVVSMDEVLKGDPIV